MESNILLLFTTVVKEFIKIVNYAIKSFKLFSNINT